MQGFIFARIQPEVFRHVQDWQLSGCFHGKEPGRFGSFTSSLTCLLYRWVVKWHARALSAPFLAVFPTPSKMKTGAEHSRLEIGGLLLGLGGLEMAKKQPRMSARKCPLPPSPPPRPRNDDLRLEANLFGTL